MSYTSATGQGQLLDGLAGAINDIAAALVALGVAYELLDEPTADALEEHLFGPVQRAYGRGKRTHAAFAARSGVRERVFRMPAPGAPSAGVSVFVERAVGSVARADEQLVALQESTEAIEVGDVELRAGVAEVRQLLGEVPERARIFQRTLGR